MSKYLYLYLYLCTYLYLYDTIREPVQAQADLLPEASSTEANPRVILFRAIRALMSSISI